MPEEPYAYLIVGAGSAGCVRANRLSEDADMRVLHDWGYSAAPEPTMNGRRIRSPSRRVTITSAIGLPPSSHPPDRNRMAGSAPEADHALSTLHSRRQPLSAFSCTEPRNRHPDRSL